MGRFVEVILPLPLEQLFTYSVPDEFLGLIQPGMRLAVPFGRTHVYTALAVRTHDEAPSGYKVRPIQAVLDQKPCLLPSQMELLKWVADYYMCSCGDVMKAMMPAALRPGDDRMEDYKPRTEVCVRLRGEYDEARLNGLFAEMSRAPRQVEMLTAFLDMSGLAVNPAEEPLIVTKRALLARCPSSAALDSLVQRGILECWKHETGRLPHFDGRLFQPNALNGHQSAALDEIRSILAGKNVCLLHGVTSSGKTEVYIHLMSEYVRSGGQVLFLLPEIALTLQIMRRLQRVFGNDLCVYHSRCSDAERAEIWKRQLSDHPFKVVVGARSAVYLPFTGLKLVVVDEEHDPSYKQEEPAPRYNGRNVALVLASMTGARVLLGSATPSVESYFNAQTGKYGLVSMTQRYMDLPMPHIDVVDVYELRRRKRMKGLVSPQLKELIGAALHEGNQVILFRNRRGYAPVMRCLACGWVPKCDSCDVSLTWHRTLRRMSCHYCGKIYTLPAVCPECGGTHLDTFGYGTEKVEEEIHQLFPQAVTGRLDMDTATTTAAYERILQDFQDGITDILIGTQMVTKGLDFDRVSVVGILDADSIMGAPDFRSTERAFQMMQQVAGRAGRRYRQGHVIVQTRQAGSPLYQMVSAGDYSCFYNDEIAERKMFRYPPFCRIISIYLRGTDAIRVDEASQWLGRQMSQVFGDRVLGPDAPPVSRVHMQYIRKLMLKVEPGIAMAPVRERLKELRDSMCLEYRSVSLFFDVDPM